MVLDLGVFVYDAAKRVTRAGPVLVASGAAARDGWESPCAQLVRKLAAKLVALEVKSMLVVVQTESPDALAWARTAYAGHARED